MIPIIQYPGLPARVTGVACSCKNQGCLDSVAVKVEEAKIEEAKVQETKIEVKNPEEPQLKRQKIIENPEDVNFLKIRKPDNEDKKSQQSDPQNLIDDIFRFDVPPPFSKAAVAKKIIRRTKKSDQKIDEEFNAFVKNLKDSNFPIIEYFKDKSSINFTKIKICK